MTRQFGGLWRHRYIFGLGAGLLILGLATYLRLANISNNPAWFSDEGTHLEIARHLLAGRSQYFAVGDSTLLFARLPLFDWLLAGAIGVAGNSMTTLRGITGLFGVFSILLLTIILYQVGKRDENKGLSAGIHPYIAPFLLAIYPQAILYSRFGFSYNLLSLFVLGVLWGLWHYLATPSSRTGLITASICVGFGLITDLWIGTLLPALLLVTFLKKPRDLLIALTLSCAPFALYAGYHLLLHPNIFLFDLKFTLSRLNTQSTWKQISLLANNLTILFWNDPFFLLGFFGLFRLRQTLFRRVTLLLMLFPLLSLGRTVPLYSLNTYYLIPLMPLLAIGVGQLAIEAGQWVVTGLFDAVRAGIHYFPMPRQGRWAIAPAITTIGLILIFILPLWMTIRLTVQQVNGRYPTPIDPFLVDGIAAQQAAKYINQHRHPADVTLASPAVGWLIDGNVADFPMAVAAQGLKTPLLPAKMPASRFLFDPRLPNVQFAVVDSTWLNWGLVHVAGMDSMLTEIQSWRLVFNQNNIQIYQQTTP